MKFLWTWNCWQPNTTADSHVVPSNRRQCSHQYNLSKILTIWEYVSKTFQNANLCFHKNPNQKLMFPQSFQKISYGYLCFHTFPIQKNMFPQKTILIFYVSTKCQILSLFNPTCLEKIRGNAARFFPVTFWKIVDQKWSGAIWLESEFNENKVPLPIFYLLGWSQTLSKQFKLFATFPTLEHFALNI